ncbi:DUF3667 domain-containing protein [Mucilaginibacter aquatilis]|uniref:DUF3667 domain-containing protein n=1 Tax=Mucilaginibacter aquatilis TaxID=1517760 RepID=A0A6I4I8T3_9SPHI|nr:DUF3667 domain-containing protein [Mucilaginibacter aquatilis]MVN91551.1 DUF3667 domain-containing protein [Mucilaginibacter aquatilis]
MILDTITCGHCHNEITHKFCSQCGQPAKLNRIDAHYIQHEVLHVLHFEKGILYTIKELLLNPGKSVRAFIAENRSRLVKPVIFIILSSLLYTVVSHSFHLDEGYITIRDKDNLTTSSIKNWVQSHYGYANIIMGICIAGWLQLFFRRSNYNYFEILILLCFVMGMGMLILSVFALIEGITSYKTMAFSVVISLGYSAWAIGDFFDSRRKIGRYFKALAAYLLGMLTFSVMIFMLNTTLNLITKH